MDDSHLVEFFNTLDEIHIQNLNFQNITADSLGGAIIRENYWNDITPNYSDDVNGNDKKIREGYKKFNKDVETYLKKELANIKLIENKIDKIAQLEIWLTKTFKNFVKITIMSVLNPKFEYDLNQLKKEFTRINRSGGFKKILNNVTLLSWDKTMKFKKTLLLGATLTPATLVKSFMQGSLVLAELRDYEEYPIQMSRSHGLNLVDACVNSFKKDYPKIISQLDTINNFNTITDKTIRTQILKTQLSKINSDDIDKFVDGFTKMIENIAESSIQSFWLRLIKFGTHISIYTDNWNNVTQHDGDITYEKLQQFLKPYGIRSFLKNDYALENEDRLLNTYLLGQYFSKFFDYQMEQQNSVFRNKKRITKKKSIPTIVLRFSNIIIQSCLNLGSIKKLEFTQILDPYILRQNFFEVVALSYFMYHKSPFRSLAGKFIAIPFSMIMTKIIIVPFIEIIELCKNTKFLFPIMFLLTHFIMGKSLYKITKSIAPDTIKKIDQKTNHKSVLWISIIKVLSMMIM